MFTFDISKRLGALVPAAAAAAAMLLPSSCITDEGIPYPDIQANFRSFAVENQQRAAIIDTVNCCVTVFLNDSADIEGVRVTNWVLGPTGARLVDESALSAPLNLTDTLDVMLEVYRQYQWQITARQTISRLFTVADQIGSSVIDVDAHTAAAVVPAEVPITAVQVDSLKLGGATAVMLPDLNGRSVDFSEPVRVEVTEFGRTTIWTVSVTQTEQNVSLQSVEAWTGVIWATAAARQGSDVRFEYAAANGAWTDVPAADIRVDGATYTARINGLQPLTTYEVRAISGDETTVARQVTTGPTTQLPDCTFTQWWKNGAVWCPWAENGTPYWDTGNKGAATLGQSNVVPLKIEANVYQGAVLQTKFVGVSILGKLAAGSIFAGEYVRTDGTNGVLSFGRPFTERPTKVRARIRYENTPIDYTTSGFESMKGQPDTCSVWCALWDGDEPFEIRTNSKNRQLFDRDLPNVVAYGQFCSGNPIADFTTIDIDLEYTAVDRVPKYILLVSAASKYGDYFTGGTGTTLWLDSYELIYDY